MALPARRLHEDIGPRLAEVSKQCKLCGNPILEEDDNNPLSADVCLECLEYAETTKCEFCGVNTVLDERNYCVLCNSHQCHYDEELTRPFFEDYGQEFQECMVCGALVVTGRFIGAESMCLVLSLIFLVLAMLAFIADKQSDALVA